MELWRIYRYTVFINKQTKKNKKYALETFCRAMYAGKKKKYFLKPFSDDEIKNIRNHAIERSFIEMSVIQNTKNLRIAASGRDLIEMHGLGFIVVAGKKYSVLLSILTGLAAIISVIISISK